MSDKWQFHTTSMSIEVYIIVYRGLWKPLTLFVLEFVFAIWLYSHISYFEALRLRGPIGASFFFCGMRQAGSILLSSYTMWVADQLYTPLPNTDCCLNKS